MAYLIKPALFAAPLLALAACALPAPEKTGANNTPLNVHVAGPASTNQGTPPYAQLIPFESSMGIVQSRNSLPPGAQ